MDVVRDYEPQVPQSPQTARRTILRTILVMLLTTFLLTILILFFTIGAPSVRTIRYNMETAVDKLSDQELSFGTTSDTWTCPCQSQVSYSDFMKLNLTRSPEDPGMLLQIDDNSHYNAEQNENRERFFTCQNITNTTCGRYRSNTPNFRSSVGCETMLFSTMKKRGTVIPFNYVSKASLVWQAAASQAQAALLAAIPYRLQWDFGEGNFQNQWLYQEDLLTVMSFAWSQEVMLLCQTQQPFGTRAMHEHRVPCHMVSLVF